MEDGKARQDTASVIEDAIEGFLEALKNNKAKLTVNDLLRLLELRDQLRREQVREVRVTWVESKTDPSATST